MIARELTSSSPASRPTARPARAARRATTPLPLQRQRRATGATCWEADPLPRRRLRRGPGVRARRCSPPAGRKVYHPGAAVLHAHDYPPVEFMRRYFDEYRGLRETIGHVEALRRALERCATCAARSPATGAGCASSGWRARERARWTARSLAHHGGPRCSPRSARAPTALPRRCSARLSLEGRRGRDAARRRRAAPPARRRAPRAAARPSTTRSARRARRPGAAARRPSPGMAERDAAARRGRDPAVPARQRRPQLDLPDRCSRLERAGPHRARSGSHDPIGLAARPSGRRSCASTIRECFAPLRGAGVQGLRRLVRRRRRRRHRLADRLPGAAARPAAARAPTSCRTTSPSSTRRPPSAGGRRRPTAAACTRSPRARGCADIVRERYGGTRVGVRVRRRPRRLPPARRRRAAATRSSSTRARRRRGAPSPLGAARARRSCRRRRPDLRDRDVRRHRARSTRRSRYEHVGRRRRPSSSRWLYSEATVGLVPVDDQLLADPAGDDGLRAAVRRPRRASAPRSVFGADGPVELAPFDPLALADALERLLDDERAVASAARTPGARSSPGARGTRRAAGRGRAARGAAAARGGGAY